MAALAIYRNLKTVILAGNPFADNLGDGLKKEVLLHMSVKMVNDEEVTPEDIEEVNELRKQREQEAKEAAEAAAEAARAAAEAEKEGAPAEDE